MEKQQQAWVGFMAVMLAVASFLIALRALGIFEVIGGLGTAIVIGVNLVVIGLVGILAFRRGKGSNP